VQEENHLRWDSLGEFLALAVSLDEMGIKQDNPRARLLARCLDQATETLLDNDKSPSRRAGELDSRGSHYYLALYWAEALAAQTEDKELAEQAAPLARQLAENEQRIVEELNAVQGRPAELGGYYHAPRETVQKVMRPSETLNGILSGAMR
jgi:isocitrate dehydrogenase